MTRCLLTRILEPAGLSVRVQPIVDLSGVGAEPQLFGFECLTRGPEDSLFHSADLLFDYVRRKHAEPLVDRHCIRNALHASRRVPSRSMISLNVHASTIVRDSDFHSFLMDEVAKNQIPASRIVIEIVEHGAAEDTERFNQSIADLRSAGVQIALDDVGLGYSNYRMILELRPEFFKVDAYIVKNCSRDRNRRAVLRSLVALATDLNSQIIAEGVETGEDLQVVQGFGIGLIQGYYFSPPLAPEEIASSELVAGLFGQLAEERF